METTTTSNSFIGNGYCPKCYKPYVYMGDCFQPDFICQCNTKKKVKYSLLEWKSDPIQERIAIALEKIIELLEKEIHIQDLYCRGNNGNKHNYQNTSLALRFIPFVWYLDLRLSTKDSFSAPTYTERDAICCLGLAVMAIILWEKNNVQRCSI